MEEFSKSEVVVLDNGEYSIKIGFGGEDSLWNEYLNVIGFPKNMAITIGPENKEYFIGDEI